MCPARAAISAGGAPEASHSDSAAWRRGTVALVDRGWPETGRVTARRTTSVFAGFRFPPEVISVAVRWYLRYGLSYRDAEELPAERGMTVDHVTSTGGCSVSPRSPSRPPARAATPPVTGGSSARRDPAATRRFFARVLRAGTVPVEVTTDRALSTRGYWTSWSLGAAHLRAVRG
jgi:transposase, IS6 family